MITDKQLKSLKAIDKPYKVWDKNGLLLLVKPNGTMCWQYKYRFNGREKLLSLGIYDVVNLSEARDKHHEARKLLADGIDPSQKKQADKIQQKLDAENSFQSVAKLWHDANLKKWDAKNAKKIWRSLEIHVFPALGRKPVNEIKPNDIFRMIKPIEKRDNTHISHRILQRCSAIFQYAISADIAERNPASEIKGALVAHVTKNLPTIEAKELPDFFKTLDNAATSELNKLAIRLLAHTFVRQHELRRAIWEEFDLNNKLWNIPAENTKMRREHVVPLSSQVLALLKQIREITGNSVYLLPTQNQQKNPYMSEGTITSVLKKMGYKDKMVGHGFRALATTTLNEAGFDRDVIERQMQHVEENKTRGAYHRSQYIEPRTNMMNWWSNFLDRAEKGESKVVTGKFGRKR